MIYFCENKGNNSGFVHICKVLNKFGEVLIEVKTQYYNRTWESYSFQSVMRKAQEKLIKTIEKAKKNKIFINYRYEDFIEYDFDNQPIEYHFN